MTLVGAIEAGGTKWVCAVGSSATQILATETFPTTSPDETIGRAIAFFREHVGGPPAAIGIASFGPLDLDSGSSSYGWITQTPKPGWQNTDLLGAVSHAFDVPVAIDTDVNAAALGELLHGAGVGISNLFYVTVGTGIGGGAIVQGELLHGRTHPEFGHIRIPHDLADDPFNGACPYHGDCLEGLASGEALRRRFGIPAENLEDARTWTREAHYLALGLLNATMTLSPERIVIGGGVMRRPQLLERVRARHSELAADYLAGLDTGGDTYIVAPVLAELSAIAGALELALRCSLTAGSTVEDHRQTP